MQEELASGAELFAEAGDVAVGVDVVFDVGEGAVFGDDESRAQRAFEGVAVDRLLTKRSVGLREFCTRVREQWEGQLLVVRERLQCLSVVGRPRAPGILQRPGREVVAEVAGLCRAAGCCGLRVEVEDDLLPGEVRLRVGLSAGIGQEKSGAVCPTSSCVAMMMRPFVDDCL